MSKILPKDMAQSAEPGAGVGHPKRVTFSPDVNDKSLKRTPRKAPLTTSDRSIYMKARHHDEPSGLNVGIVAVTHIVDAKKHIGRRTLWICIMIACIAGMVYLIYERTIKYLDHPVNVSIRENFNKSLIFPAVTLCKKNPWNYSKIINIVKEAIDKKHTDDDTLSNWDSTDHFQSLLSSDGKALSVADFWTLFAHDYNILVANCYYERGRKCTEYGKWQAVTTVIGICATYLPTTGMVKRTGTSNSLFVKLEGEKHTRKDLVGYMMLVHMATDPPLYEILMNGIQIKAGTNDRIQLNLKVYQRINRKQRPCNSDPLYYNSVCLAKCFSRELFLRLECTLPFMIGVKGKPCTKDTQYREVGEEIEKLILRGQWPKNQCNCDIRCNDMVITTQQEHNHRDDKNSAKISIFYDTMKYETYEESHTYNLVSYLSDIGGSLGLLLGASLLTVVELYQDIMDVIKKWTDKAKSSKKKEETLQNMGFW